MKRNLLTILAIVSFLFLFGFTYSQNSKPVTFEYKFEDGCTEKRANELGAQGWELAGIQAQGGMRISPIYVFKKAK